MARMTTDPPRCPVCGAPSTPGIAGGFCLQHIRPVGSGYGPVAEPFGAPVERPKPRGTVAVSFTPEEYERVCIAFSFEGKRLQPIFHDLIMAVVAERLEGDE